jgi:1-acyl-sn-glycerol-3-phosphate acyltransferase
LTRFRYSANAWRLFSLAFGPRMRLGVRKTLFTGVPRELPNDTPLLLVANHVSWWDGFILRPLHQEVRRGGALHIVMLEKELQRRPLLRRLGGIGLEPGSPSSLRALLRDLGAERRRDPSLSVLFFPQGRIWPSHRSPLGFRGGVRLLTEALAPVTVLPVGLHLEGGNHMAPTAFASCASPMLTDGGLPLESFESPVHEELRAIHDFLARYGEDAEAHWPGSGGRLSRTQ